MAPPGYTDVRSDGRSRIGDAASAAMYQKRTVEKLRAGTGASGGARGVDKLEMLKAEASKDFGGPKNPRPLSNLMSQLADMNFDFGGDEDDPVDPRRRPSNDRQRAPAPPPKDTPSSSSRDRSYSNSRTSPTRDGSRGAAGGGRDYGYGRDRSGSTDRYADRDQREKDRSDRSDRGRDYGGERDRDRVADRLNTRLNGGNAPAAAAAKTSNGTFIPSRSSSRDTTAAMAAVRARDVGNRNPSPLAIPGGGSSGSSTTSSSSRTRQASPSHQRQPSDRYKEISTSRDRDRERDQQQRERERERDRMSPKDRSPRSPSIPASSDRERRPYNASSRDDKPSTTRNVDAPPRAQSPPLSVVTASSFGTQPTAQSGKSSNRSRSQSRPRQPYQRKNSVESTSSGDSVGTRATARTAAANGIDPNGGFAGSSGSVAAAMTAQLVDKSVTIPARNGSRGAPSVSGDKGSNMLKAGGIANKYMSTLTVSSHSSAAEAADAMLMQLMVQEALIDAKSFSVLPGEKFESTKKDLDKLRKEVSSLQNRLGLEQRIREAALSLASFGDGDAGGEELEQANKKVDKIATDLWKATGALMAAERSVLKHIGAVLGWEVKNLKKQEGKVGGADKALSPSSPSAASSALGDALKKESEELASTRQKLESAESRIKEQETMISVLKSTVSRLENEQDDLGRKYEGAKDEAVAAQAERDGFERTVKKMERAMKENEEEIRQLKSAITASANSSSSSSRGRGATGSDHHPTPAEYNRLKLDLATTRAELAGLKEELSATRDNVANLQLQLEEDQGLIETKDRQIANLLSELEEVTNQLDMQQAAAAAAASHAATSLPSPTSAGESSKIIASLRAHVSALEGQLKEARASKDGGAGGITSPPLSPTLKSTPRTTSVYIREQVAQQLSSQTENLRSMLGTQLKEAVIERERLKLQLLSEGEKVKDLETRLEEALRNGGGSRGGFGAGAGGDSDTETEDEGSSGFANRRMYGNNSSSRKPRNEYKNTAGSNSGFDSREKEKLENQVSDLQAELRNMKSSMDSLRLTYEDVTRALAPSSALGFSIDALCSQVGRLISDRAALAKQKQDMQGEVRDLQDRIHSLQDQLRDSRESNMRDANAREGKLIDEISTLESELSETSQQLTKAKRDIEQLESSERRLNAELRTVTENYTRLRSESDDMHVKLAQFEETKSDLSRVKAELKEARSQMADTEQVFKSQAGSIERQHADQVKKLKDDFRREMENLRNLMEAEHKEQLADLESTFRKQAKEMESMHQREISNVAALEGELETFKKKYDQEREALTSRYETELSRLKNQHQSELQALNELHTTETDSLQQRLGRSETALVQVKSQIFQDQERYQETIEDLENQVRQMKQQHVEMTTSTATQAHEIELLEAKIKSKEAELARMEQASLDAEASHKDTVSSLTAQYEDKIAALQRTIADFEDMKSEMETIERDHLLESSKYEQEIATLEARLRESKERIETLEDMKAELEMQLEKAERDLMEVRRKSGQVKVDREAEQALLGEIERLQMTIVTLKTEKVELLEELDNQQHREQSMQQQMNAVMKEFDRLTRNFTDWDSERRSYEDTITDLRKQVDDLQTRLQEAAVDKLQSGGDNSNSKTRLDFRKMLADVRSEYSAQLNKEIAAKGALEAEIRKMKRDREMESYKKVNEGTQTQLKWVTGDKAIKMYGV